VLHKDRDFQEDMLALLAFLVAIFVGGSDAYHLLGTHAQALQRSGKLLLGAKRSSGSGGGAMPPTQADNIQSWGK